MENLNAEQVKNCLVQDIECGCGMYREVDVTDLKRALALINSQEQRIKELTEKYEKLSNAFNDLLKEAETYLKQREAFQSRVKYLEKENARLVEDNHILATEFKDKVKADTVRKMQERLKAKAVGFPNYIGEVIAARGVDQIAKEMLEVAQRPEVLNDQPSGLSDPEGDRLERRTE